VEQVGEAVGALLGVVLILKSDKPKK